MALATTSSLLTDPAPEQRRYWAAEYGFPQLSS